MPSTTAAARSASSVRSARRSAATATVRVSADGRLYTCLFSAGGVDLRPILAQGEPALAERLAALWSTRADRYSELRGSERASTRHVEMYLVGG